MLGQISRFVRRGAVRIESPYGSTRTVTNCAFAHPDNTLLLVVVNQTRQEQRFTIAIDAGNNARPERSAVALLPAKTVATYTWSLA
jgi:glucosylceramidase